jgi:hypothetical protein
MASLWLLALLITVPLVLFIGMELLGTYETYLFANSQLQLGWLSRPA